MTYDWNKDIERTELYIKLERTNLLKYKCWAKAQEYFDTFGTYPAWDDFQTARLKKIRSNIMKQINQMSNDKE